jgi:hypothetical protein
MHVNNTTQLARDLCMADVLPKTVSAIYRRPPQFAVAVASGKVRQERHWFNGARIPDM